MSLNLSTSVRGALSVSLLAVSAAAQSLFSQAEIVMAEGDPIPGLAGAVNGGASSLDTAITDLDGNLLFRARFTGGGATLNVTDRAYFYGRSKDTLQMIIRGGDPEPSGTLGAGVLMINQLTTSQSIGIGGSPRLSPRGSWIMFGSSLVGPGILNTGTAATGRNDAALFHGRPGAWQVLAQRGGQTGVNATIFDTAFSGISYQQSSLNESGIAAFQATLAGGDVVGTTNNFATFTGLPGSLSLVIRKGDLIPVAGGGTARVGFVGFNAALNRSGWVLHDERFDATGGTTPATTANDSTLMVWFPGGVNQIIMREGDQAPTLAAGINFGSPTISQGFGQTGGCAFGTTLTGAVTTANDNSLWLGGLGGFLPVWREGDVNPAVPGAINAIANSTSSYSDYQGGSVAFFGTLADGGGGTITTANDQGLWLAQAGNLQLIAREGDAAPGFSNRPGFVSATFGPLQAGSVQMNERGQLMWGSTDVNVVDAGGAVLVTSCQFTYDPINGVQLLFQGGETFTTVAGPTVANNSGGIQFPSSDGAPLTLNNQGDLVQRVNFNTGGAMVRAHIGSNQCKPSTISGLAGGVHTMELDAGVTNANQIYLVLCGGLGTRPGFSFGGSQIDLNIDPVWTDLAFNSLNTAPWAGTFGLLDGTGKASASFTVPPSIFIYAPQDLKHVVAVVDLTTLAVPFAGEPCSVLLY